MECNRDEALRAREIAEIKFSTKDIEGAKKFALKAQSLYPGLDGISQMIATLDIYLAAQSVDNGEKDWYSILGVSTSADEDIIRKQYKISALLLHPDKNKSIGAEGAFKLISQAWSVLSDKSKRMAYDQKRNIKHKEQRAAQPNREYSFPNTAYVFHHSVKSAASGARIQRNAPCAAPPPVPHSSTFWTSCNSCKMQYEYLKIYLNHNLICPKCNAAFMATAIPVPTNAPSSVPWAAEQNQQSLRRSHLSKNTFSSEKSTPAIPGMRTTGIQQASTFDSYGIPNFQQAAIFGTAGAANAAASSAAARQSVDVVHEAYKKERRENKEAEAAVRNAELLQRKMNISSKSTAVQFSGNANPGFANNISKRVCPSVPKEERPAKKIKIGNDGGSVYVGNGSEPARANDFTSDSWKITRHSSVLSRELSQLNIRNMLTRKAKVAILKKLEDLGSLAAAELAEKEKAKQKQKQKKNDGKEKAEIHRDASDEIELKSRDKHAPDEMITPNNFNVEADGDVQGTISMNVSDPDFHDFDMDRVERCFQADQIWATYDDDDGMPRFYVMIRDVLSFKPFKVRLSFLNSRSTSEFGQLNWIGSGFTKTCGDFRIGKNEIRRTVNIFSHRVRWERGLKGAIRIVPQKGDIWAIYKNWSPDWSEDTPVEIMHRYEMVEVLDDYIVEGGVCIIPLVKVADFKTVFCRHLNPEKARRIPREEMFCFSHQVPHYILTGKEANNAPRGCYELDPAATPLELLQVASEAEEEMVRAAEQPSDC
ncbi:hypothetical protein Taro_015271 [Colocasia esculenta]|uniref:J domain-containing protein n=1 Tax=Colocasia esculenta TaxID=4460 RepID=A0A843UGX7_COLES|nr:hypothetical protein [Colocasia esculenta]